jgi:hypothetical protein
MVYTKKQRKIAKAMESLVHKRFNEETLKAELNKIFGKEIDGFELGYDDVEEFPDWDYMFAVNDDEIGGDFDVYVLMHKNKDMFGNTLYVTEVAYDFCNSIIIK